VDGEHNEAMDEEEDQIESLKQKKAHDKSALTRIKTNLLSLLDEVKKIIQASRRSRRLVKGFVNYVRIISRIFNLQRERETKKELTNGIFGRLRTRIKNIWTIGWTNY